MTKETDSEENYFDRLVRTGASVPLGPCPPETISEQLLDAMNYSGRTIYELSKAIKIEPDSLYRFVQGSDIRLETAAKLCLELGLELRPIKRKRTRKKSSQ
jgi:phenylalanyl-tRNA synthetase beta subunit